MKQELIELSAFSLAMVAIIVVFGPVAGHGTLAYKVMASILSGV